MVIFTLSFMDSRPMYDSIPRFFLTKHNLSPAESRLIEFKSHCHFWRKGSMIQFLNSILLMELLCIQIETKKRYRNVSVHPSFHTVIWQLSILYIRGLNLTTAFILSFSSRVKFGDRFSSIRQTLALLLHFPLYNQLYIDPREWIYDFDIIKL